MSLSIVQARRLLRSTTSNDGIPGAPEVLNDGKADWIYVVLMTQ